ncbi:hypothetical protein [Anaerocolumna xylanovorans]|uniref:GGDEF domain-containing protein n=1 Tax=Anaerocolumna xylanovorans DSM 12503 TaxID=1121345 RepID=A0A1M7YC70_9FIRM|nr:hypothetical protein [Anaerocolumna xylanovorans]SHO50234.1 hypothetical protein SAMN02745217_02648 [Anaerocolumna xylanovorans DSM 12503]
MRRKGIILGIAAVFCLIWIVLIFYDIRSYSSNMHEWYRNHQADMAEQYLKEAERINTVTGAPLKTILAKIIEEDYPTSAGNYCFLAVDGQVIFEKDRVYKSTPLEKYLNVSSNELLPGNLQDAFTGKYRISDGKTYIVSMVKYEDADGICIMGIATSENYFSQLLDTKTLQFHMVFYTGVLALLLMAASYHVSTKLKQNEEQIAKQEMELASSRQVIDRLNDDILVSDLGEKYLQSGFLSKDMVVKLMDHLTDEQLKACVKIKIDIVSKDYGLVANVAAILAKLQYKKTISCIWSEREFRVLLLNVDMQETCQFLQQFYQMYQLYFGKIPADVQIQKEDVSLDWKVVYGI